MTDRCRQERTAALRRLIEDAEASGISECRVDDIFAEALPLSDEHRWRAAEKVKKGGAPPANVQKRLVDPNFLDFRRDAVHYRLVDNIAFPNHTQLRFYFMCAKSARINPNNHVSRCVKERLCFGSILL